MSNTQPKSKRKHKRLFEIIGVDGVIHDNCPACHSDWEVLSENRKPFSYGCVNCTMCAIYSWRNYMLVADLDDDDSDNDWNYSVFWQNGKCFAVKIDNNGREIRGSRIPMPTLPYTITLDKLKTYLAFA